MPYAIRKDGDEKKPFCLYKKDDGAKMGCHESRDDAQAQIRAIYASKAAYAVVESFIDEAPEDEAQPEMSDAEIELAILEESSWSGYIAFEGIPTGDNREFAEGAITWDELPLPLLYQKSSTDGHGGSVVIGRVDEIERHDGGKVFARGVILNTPEGADYKALMEVNASSGVSIDGDSAEYSVEEQESGKPKVLFNSIRIRGLTCVAIAAFSEAHIKLDSSKDQELDDEEEGLEDFELRKKRKKAAYKKAMTSNWAAALTAAAPVQPPLSWFDDQKLPGPTPQTVLETGQVFGHLALWGTCHIGMPACTKPPKGGTYGYFHTGALETLEGVEVSVGHLTFNTGHASMTDSAFSAASHYDHTGTVAADVVVGEDEYGIWFAGALRPHLSDEDARAFKAAPLSGDWRRIGSRMELVGALSVNTPGFPIPRQRTKVLVASGHDETFISTLPLEDYEMIGREIYKQDLVARVEVFYNKCHGEGGMFCEGPDGPGRVRDKGKESTTKEVRQGKSGTMRDSGGKVLHSSRTSSATNETTKSARGYQEAHDLMAESQSQLEAAVKNAKTPNDKKYYTNELGKMKGERLRWAAEADRLGERVERMESNLEAAKTAKSGDPATDRRRLREAKDFASEARERLLGHIGNKVGQYKGFADDSKRGIQSHAEYNKQQKKIQAGTAERKASAGRDDAVRQAGAKANKTGVDSLTPAERKLLGIE